MKKKSISDRYFTSMKDMKSPFTSKDISGYIQNNSLPKSRTKTMLHTALATSAIIAMSGLYTFLSPEETNVQNISNQQETKQLHISKVEQDDTPSIHIESSEIENKISVNSKVDDSSVFDILNLNMKGFEKVMQELASSDSMIALPENSQKQRVIVKVFKGEDLKEIQLTHSASPLPFMITSQSGMGQVLTGEINPSIDVNELIPVSDKKHGIMWYIPNDEFLQSVPKKFHLSLAASLPEEIQGLAPQIDSLVNSSIDSVMQQILANRPKNDSQKVIIKRYNSIGNSLHLDGNMDSLMQSMIMRSLSDKDSLNNRSVKPKVIIMRGHTMIPGSNQSFMIRSGKMQSQGIIKDLSVSPNPATSSGARLQFQLLEDRIISISLLDLRGNTIMNVEEQSSYPKGLFSTLIPLNSIQQGMYLLRVTTDKGESAIHRLIVKP